jgi:hypothetical protein
LLKRIAMTKKMFLLLMSAWGCLLSPGCTYRAWYAGLQERQRQECYQNLSQSEVQKCLDSVNSTTYDEYLRTRQGSATPAK